jgi:hypothetical protein
VTTPTFQSVYDAGVIAAIGQEIREQDDAEPECVCTCEDCGDYIDDCACARETDPECDCDPAPSTSSTTGRP